MADTFDTLGDFYDVNEAGGGSRARAKRENFMSALIMLNDWLQKLAVEASSDDYDVREDAVRTLKKIVPGEVTRWESTHAMPPPGADDRASSTGAMARHVVSTVPMDTIFLRHIRPEMVKIDRYVSEGREDEAYATLLEMHERVSIPLWIVGAALRMYPQSLALKLYRYEIELYEGYLGEILPDDLEGESKAFFTMDAVWDIGNQLLYNADEDEPYDPSELADTYDGYRGEDGALTLDSYIQETESEDTPEQLMAEAREKITVDDFILPMSKILRLQPPFMRGSEYPDL